MVSIRFLPRHLQVSPQAVKPLERPRERGKTLKLTSNLSPGSISAQLASSHFGSFYHFSTLFGSFYPFFYPRAHSRGAAETFLGHIFSQLQIGELMWNKRKCGASCNSEISTEWEPSFKIIFRVRLRLSKWLQFLSF